MSQTDIQPSSQQLTHDTNEVARQRTIPPPNHQPEAGNATKTSNTKKLAKHSATPTQAPTFNAANATSTHSSNPPISPPNPPTNIQLNSPSDQPPPYQPTNQTHTLTTQLHSNQLANVPVNAYRYPATWKRPDNKRSKSKSQASGRSISKPTHHATYLPSQKVDQPVKPTAIHTEWLQS